VGATAGSGVSGALDAAGAGSAPDEVTMTASPINIGCSRKVATW